MANHEFFNNLTLELKGRQITPENYLIKVSQILTSKEK